MGNQVSAESRHRSVHCRVRHGSDSDPQAGGRAGLITQLSESRKWMGWECCGLTGSVCGFGSHFFNSDLLARAHACEIDNRLKTVLESISVCI